MLIFPNHGATPESPWRLLRCLIIGMTTCIFGWAVFAVIENHRLASIDENVRRNGAFSAAAARSVSIGLDSPKANTSKLAPLLRSYNRTKNLVVEAGWVSDSELIALIGVDSVAKLRIIRKHIARDVLQAICDRLESFESVTIYAASFDPGSEKLLEAIRSDPRNKVDFVLDFSF